MFCLQGGLSEGIPFVLHGLPQQRWEQQGNVEKASGQGGPKSPCCPQHTWLGISGDLHIIRRRLEPEHPIQP